MMISKELLSEVLGENVTGVKFCIEGDRGQSTSTTRLNISIDIKDTAYFNIYELQHLCKEWAIKQDYGYIINSCIKHTFGYAQVEWYEKNHKDKHGTYREHTFKSEWFRADGNSEAEAVFKATQWIMENR